MILAILSIYLLIGVAYSHSYNKIFTRELQQYEDNLKFLMDSKNNESLTLDEKNSISKEIRKLDDESREILDLEQSGYFDNEVYKSIVLAIGVLFWLPLIGYAVLLVTKK